MKMVKRLAFATLCIIVGFIVVGVVVALVIAVPFIGVPLAIACVFLWFWQWSKANKSQSAPASNAEKRKPSPQVAAAGSSPLSLTVNRKIEIMNDCVRILNTSTNLQTVISRYAMLLETLQELSGYESNPAISFPHELPSVALERIKSEKPQIMNSAIQRAYDDVLHKCAALKTETGRKNRHMKFFDELNALMDKLPPESREFAVDFIKRNIDDPLTGLEGL